MRCPLPYLLAVLGYRVASQFRYACKRGMRWVIREPQWVVCGGPVPRAFRTA